jgi:hypothetical protein
MCMLSERTQVLLTPAQRRRLERLAEGRRVSMGALIREAIDAYTVPAGRSRRDAADLLFSLETPSQDWEVMKEEIQRGATA